MSGQLDSTITKELGGAPRPPRRLPITIDEPSWRRIGSGISLAAVAGLLAVALGEIDRLIASVPAGDGRSHPLNVLLSPIGVTKTDSWTQWATAAPNEQLGEWIRLSAILDVGLAVALTMLFLRLILLERGRPARVPTTVLAVYLAAEAMEDALQFGGGAAVSAGNAEIATLLGTTMAVATAVKCLALLVLGLAFLRIESYRGRLARWFRRIGQAVWVHRLATLAIIVIVVLACIPAADLLDQLPDVQRQWADGDVAWQMLWAVFGLVVTSAVAFVLGRRRTRLLVETRVFGLRPRPAPSRIDAAAPWVIAPCALLTAAVLAGGFVGGWGADAGIHAPTFLAMLWLTLLVPILAWIGWRPGREETQVGLDRDRALFGWLVGDSLAVLVLVAGGIGLVRSYVAPVMLLSEQDGWQAAWSIRMLVIGALSATLIPWLLLPWLGRRRWAAAGLDPNVRATSAPPIARLDPNDSYVSPAGLVEQWSLFVSGTLLLAGMLFPVWVAMLFGGVATTLLALSAWVTLFGSFTLLVQPRALIAPFRWLRLKAAPVLTLGIILPFAVNLLVSAVAPDQQLHAVQVSNPDPAPDPVGDPVEQRLEDLQSDGCELSLPGVDVRPVFLIAAEGGGIRAAYWTASTLARLEGCAAQSGFVASGISGGSVGLAVASTVDIELREENGGTAGGPKTATRIVEAARETAGPDVVSTAVLGLTVGDLFAAGSGVRVPSYLPADVAADDEGLRWRDRAALVEALWERDAPALTDRFSADISPLTGMLMLSSTDVVSKCRLLVDQVPILARETELARQTEAPSSENGCDTAGGLPSMLGFRELPASGHTHSLSECLGSLDWSTAAMLSARFAIITPTGGLPAGSPCNGAAGAQFVDGGYVEPTSLAALADAAPQLMAAIAEENSERRPGEPWLVPMLVYLRNTQGYDLAADVARAESEPLVPITGGAAKVNLTAEDSWIQRITLAMPEACPDGRKAHDCRAALQALTRRGGLLLGGVVVVAPASTPSVVPPLGWALSGLSQARFTEAIDSAAGCVRSEDAAEHLEESASTRHGQYKGLADLADLSGFDPCDDEWQFAPVTSG